MIQAAPPIPSRLHMFRYRDLIANTLESHQAIIDEHGYCWWGWWKRPNEEPRWEEWRELETAVQANELVHVALFDSGRDAAHLALIDAVKAPRQGPFDSLEIITLKDGELAVVPEYYRHSQFSRGWMRIRLISPDPFPLFDNWSYDAPPPLPGYSQEQLSRFRDKKIVDGSELRAMDTTIWTIRRSVPSDSNRSILAAPPKLLEPLDPQPIACAGEWLLHLTDAHFATGSFRDQHVWRLESEPMTARATMLDSVAGALIASGRSVGGVVITGDLTFVASKEEFEEARKALFKFITGELGLNLDNLVIVPGNHDIKWTRGDTYEDDAPVDVAPLEATAEYRSFYKRLFGTEANLHLSMARRFIFPGGNLIDVVAVNSSSLEQGKNFLSGMGRVQEQALEQAMSRLNWSSRHTGLRVLALHHHLTLLEDVDLPGGYLAGFGIAVDAGRILRLASRSRVNLVVHGHKHRPFLGKTSNYELPSKVTDVWNPGSVLISGGGSAGSSDTADDCSYFNLMKLSGGVVTLEMYRSEQQGLFERIGSWTFGVGEDAQVADPGGWQRQ